MVRTEFYKNRSDGVELIRTYSDQGMMIERDGHRYTEAIDPAGTGRTYTETEIPVRRHTEGRKEDLEERVAAIEAALIGG